MNIEFIDTGDNERKCSVHFKGVRIFDIRYADYREEYWIDTFSGAINFKHIGPNPDTDLDFVEPHKYSKTLEGAKNNCKKILYSYINWLTETK
jgi:hypothetical protein